VAEIEALVIEQHVSFALTAAAGYAVLASGYLTASGTGGSEAVGSVMTAMTI
jgi:urea transport system ATP-binding protein